MKIQGFYSTEEVVGVDYARLVVGGKSGSGKGHVALCTDLPEPIGFLPLDENGLMIAQKAKGMGKEILIPKYNFSRRGAARGIFNVTTKTSTEAEIESCKRAYKEFLSPILEALDTLANNSNVPSVVIDGMHALWQTVLSACLGKTSRVAPLERTGPNQVMRGILDSCGGKNLVLTTRVKQVWVGSGADSKPVPGVYTADSWADLDYAVPSALMMGRVEGQRDVTDLAQAWLESDTDPEVKAKFKGLRTGDWWAIVAKAHANPMASGAGSLLVNDEITYSNVMRICVPRKRRVRRKVEEE